MSVVVCIFVGIDWNDFNYIDGSLSWMFGEAFKYKPKLALIDFDALSKALKTQEKRKKEDII